MEGNLSEEDKPAEDVNDAQPGDPSSAKWFSAVKDEAKNPESTIPELSDGTDPDSDYSSNEDEAATLVEGAISGDETEVTPMNQIVMLLSVQDHC